MKHVAGIRGFVAGALVVSVVGVGGLAVVKATGGSSSASLFVAVTPVRVVDTRSDLGLNSVVSGTEQDVMIVSSVVPVGATAVAMTVTAVDASAKGFVVVRPGDATGKPSTSNINVSKGETVANAVTIKLPTVGSGAGAIKVLFDAYGSFTATTELLIDITGYYEVASVGSGSSGPAGAQGPQGEQGLRGEQGVPGEQGQRGERGQKGDIGDRGVPGDQGVAGEKGVPGDKGAAGSDGALAGLTCLDQQFIAQFNGVWKCAELGELRMAGLIGTPASVGTNPPGDTQLGDWSYYGGSYYGAYDFTPCNLDRCILMLIGVTDHSRCSVSGSVGTRLFNSTSSGVSRGGYIDIDFTLAVGQTLDQFSALTPISIQVLCGQGIVEAQNPPITPA